MAPRGGKRQGAGRKHSEPTKQMRVPESMVAAVEGLKRMAKGEFREEDLAELLIAIYEPEGAVDAWGGVVCSPERSIKTMRNEAYRKDDYDERDAIEERAEALEERARRLGI